MSLNGHYSVMCQFSSLPFFHFLSHAVSVCSWLVYTDPGFGGLVGVLEMGEYPCPESWGFPQPFIGSLRPLRMVQYIEYGYVFAQYCHFLTCIALTNMLLFIIGSNKGGAS